MSTSSSAQPALELGNLAKHFRSHAVLREVNLRVEPGTTLGLIGPNGAGKTTTMRILLGMLKPDGGAVRVLGCDPMQDSFVLRQRVGYVPEQHVLLPYMRVEELIDFCMAFYSTWDARIAEAAIKRFDLDRKQKVKHLSKGSLAKLSLVLAIAHQPEMLILDEPMGGLDVIARDEFLEGVLEAMCDKPRTVIFSSHLLADVQRMADAVAILHDGRIVAHGTVDELLASTKRVRAVLRDGGQPTRLPAGMIWQQQNGREWLMTLRDCSDDRLREIRESNPVESLVVVDIGLEDIFKDYVRGSKVTA